MSQNLITEDRVLIILGQKNLNDRIYEDNDNLRETIKDYNKRAEEFHGFGETGYPDNFEIGLSNVSHSVKNVRVEGNTVVGTVTVIDTPAGKKLEPLFDNVEFRPRATGIVNENGIVVLTKIFAFDAIPKESDSFKNIIEYKKSE